MMYPSEKDGLLLERGEIEVVFANECLDRFSVDGCRVILITGWLWLQH